ncbi:hypothetical protein [Algoriphagus sp. A40]|uniref:hypothetical protein n=1 Tax=Algoriphagus sp. A40 TaxID=1945863 RepID=UPI0009842C59|nr:hypothetical protein [Algoriphagus sp. A40]OOG74814.1 hypothetical protein B0E43_10530 [Algoriphagus sp. A40]
MFDIDMPTFIVASLFLAAIAAVFVYYSLKSKKARKEFYGKFNQFISGLNLNPNVKEDWRNRFILGLDQQNKTLVYCNFGDNEQKIAVNLPEVSKVSVLETFHETENAANTRKILDQLALKVQFKTPGKEALTLLIYSSEEYSDMLGETVLAANWASVINQQLNK